MPIKKKKPLSFLPHCADGCLDRFCFGGKFFLTCDSADVWCFLAAQLTISGPENRTVGLFSDWATHLQSSGDWAERALGYSDIRPERQTDGQDGGGDFCSQNSSKPGETESLW